MRVQRGVSATCLCSFAWNMVKSEIQHFLWKLGRMGVTHKHAHSPDFFTLYIIIFIRFRPNPNSSSYIYVKGCTLTVWMCGYYPATLAAVSVLKEDILLLMLHNPCKHTWSNSHPIWISSEFLARNGLDDSCTLACFQTRSVGLKPGTISQN